MSPYLIGGGLIVLLLSSGGSYLYGRHDGYSGRVAEEAEAKDAAFQKFAENAKAVIADATAQSFGEFDAKIATLDRVGRNLSAARNKADEAIDALSRTLRANGCVLTPDQRLRADAFRRPPGLALPGAAEAALPAPISGTGARPAAPPGR